MRITALFALIILSHGLEARALRDCEDLEGEGIYECLGATEKGRALFLKALAETGRRDDTMFRDMPPLASQLNYTDALPILKSLLANARNLPTGYANYEGDLRITRPDLSVAAKALADFDDRSAAPVIREYLTLLDSDNMGGTGWETGLKALGQLGGSDAELYGRRAVAKLLARAEDRSTLANLLAEFAVEARARGLVGDLKKINTQNKDEFTAFDEAMVQAPLMELGDLEIRKWFRDKVIPQVEYVEKNGGGVIVFPVVQPGMYLRAMSELEDLPLFIHFEAPSPEAADTRAAIERILSQPEQFAPGAFAIFKASLLEGLRKNTAAYENRNYTISDGWAFSMGALAAHYYLLARLGDDSSQRKLAALMPEQKDAGDRGSWIAVQYGLELRVPGAAEALERLFRAELQDKGDMKLWEARADAVEIAGRTLGAGDARWTLALLDPSPDVRARALHWFSRLRPAAACRVVSDAAIESRDGTSGEVVGAALTALTVHGKACIPDLVRTARSAKESFTQGIAIEVLAMLEAPEVDSLLKQHPDDARTQSARNIQKHLKQL